MRKLIFIAFLFITLGVMAQERTVDITLSRNPLSGNYSYYDYEGGSSDILIPTTRDTIDFVFLTKKTEPFDLDVALKFDPVAGADTIVYINVLGRNSTDESWTTIISDSSAAVTADAVKKSVSTYSNYDERYTIDTTLTTGALAATAIDSLAFYVADIVYSAVKYRYINVRLILPGDDSVGTGIEVKRLELKLWEK